MTLLIQILFIILSYLLGSIPFALLIGKLVKKIDIREYGSKNMGATNTFRVLGFGWGLLVFILDFLKAWVIAFIMKYNFLNLDYSNTFRFSCLVYGFAAIIGHLFPIFAKFKGGKGVSSCAGMLCAYNPWVFLCAFAGFLIVVFTTKFVSLSSITAGIVSLIAAIIFEVTGGSIDWQALTILFIAVAMLIIKHIPNLKRIKNHTESKINFEHIKDKSKPAFVQDENQDDKANDNKDDITK